MQQRLLARLLALCSLPRANPGNRKEFVRRNGPYALYMTASAGAKLPFGNLPRLLLAWMCTEAVRPHSALGYRPPAPGAYNPVLVLKPVSQPRTVI